MSNPYAPPEDRRRPADDESPTPSGHSPAGTPPSAGPDQPHAGDPGQHGQAGQHGQPGPQQHGGQYPPPHQHYPGHLPPQHHPQGQPPVPPPPTDPVGAEKVRHSSRMFGLLLLGAVVLSTVPVPWQAVALPFVVAAGVYGVRGLVQASRAHVRGVIVPMLAGGVAITAVWSVAIGAMLLLWPQLADRQECLANALTISATAECKQTFDQELERWQDRARG